MRNEVSSTNEELDRKLIEIINSDDELDVQAKEALINGITEFGWKGVELIPIIGGFVESIRGIVGFAAARHKLKNQIKLFKYFSGIKKYDEDMHKYINDENITFLIEKLLRDDESVKVKRYIKFTVNSTKNNILNQNSYLRILSSLTSDQIELMRVYYIAKHFDLEGFRNGYEREMNVHHKDELFSYNKGVLESYGLIDSSSTFQSKSIVSDLLTKMCHLIFDEEELFPNKIGLKEKNQVDIAIDIDQPFSYVYEDKLLEGLKGKIVAIKLNENNKLNYRGKYYVCSEIITTPRGDVSNIKINLHQGILFEKIDLIDNNANYNDKVILSADIPAVYRGNEFNESDVDKHIDIFCDKIQSILFK